MKGKDLISDLMLHKQEYHDFFWRKRNYARGIWQFYQEFNWAVAVLNLEIEEEESLLRNNIYMRIFLYSFDRTSLKESEFSIIDSLIKKDMAVIMEALNYLDEQSQNSPSRMGTYYRPGTIGISMEEYPEI